MIYYINALKTDDNTAGPKAPNDIYNLTKEYDGKEIIFNPFPVNKGRLYQKAWLLSKGLMQWMKVFSMAGEGDVVIYQHPTYGIGLNAKMIPLIQKKKKAKFIAVIHDLESLRLGVYKGVGHNYELANAADNQVLRYFDKIICHNDYMKKYLIEKGFEENKLVSLEIFDYLTDSPMQNQVEEGLAIAGNLSKGNSTYIYELLKTNPNYKLNLFGPYFDKSTELGDKIEYFGSFPPELLPGELRGKFGLVWDGESLETCSGNTGNYLRYNNPHKTSLYLASGLPVIIWKEAAMARFIEENKAGIVVNSLLEIENILNNISEEEYSQIKENAKKIGDKLRNGYYYKKALEKCLEEFNFNE